MDLTLDADKLVALARETTALNDLGEDTWQEGLERLIASFHADARLTDMGKVIAAGEIVMYLSTRLGVVEYHRQHPEIARAPITRPIVVIGQPRTGTTILYDLLAQDPANRAPLTWEVDRPLPPPEAATYDIDPRIDEVQAQLDMVEQIMPGFMGMHPLGARLAQECVRITGQDFRSLIFSTQYRVRSYSRWLVDQADMAPAYRWHRLYLQLLQSKHQRNRWVLKSPAHQWCLPALLAEYPDALLVQTHRDPLRVTASLSSLMTTLRKLASDDIDVRDIAEEWVGYIVAAMDRSVDAREDGTIPKDQVVDVHFRDFLADPFGTIRGIYDSFGLDLTDDAEQRMRAFLAENPSEKHGGHHYTFADTGLDEAAVRARTKRYQEYFDVPPENLS
ncbi:MAG: sulfotransferase [Actinomycetota bacterium]